MTMEETFKDFIKLKGYSAEKLREFGLEVGKSTDTCHVNWCDNPPERYKNGNRKSCCSYHMQYRKWVGNALSRMWLFYKLEKLLVGDFKCEKCGIDKQKQHPTKTIKQIIQCLEIDHIDDGLKGTFEGEQPENYQQLCSDCHKFKSDENGDYNGHKNK